MVAAIIPILLIVVLVSCSCFADAARPAVDSGLAKAQHLIQAALKGGESRRGGDGNATYLSQHVGVFPPIVDSAACEEVAYYSGFDISSPSVLHELVKNSAKHQLSYKAVWTALETLDQSENIQDFVDLIYSKKPVIKSSRENQTWNREHTWPKSFGVSCKKKNKRYVQSNGAFTDLHHMYPSNTKVNSDRSSEYFDECTPETCTYPANPLDGYTEEERESGESTDGRTFWMPPKKSRGRVARILFFMALRYNGEEAYTTDLTLSDCPRYCRNSLGKLSALIKWHSEFPPTEAERQRNTNVCDIQGNRNPFVDHPELVERFFVSSSNGQPSSHLVSSDCSPCSSPSPRAAKCDDLGTKEPVHKKKRAKKPHVPQSKPHTNNATVSTLKSSGSCASYGCNAYSSKNECQCDSECAANQNCCSDYPAICLAGSCANYGCTPYSAKRKCQCNSHCSKYNNCCSDFTTVCGAPSRPVGCADYKCVGYSPRNECQCNDKCERFKNCCSDYQSICR